MFFSRALKVRFLHDFWMRSGFWSLFLDREHLSSAGDNFTRRSLGDVSATRPLTHYLRRRSSGRSKRRGRLLRMLWTQTTLFCEFLRAPEEPLLPRELVQKRERRKRTLPHPLEWHLLKNSYGSRKSLHSQQVAPETAPDRLRTTATCEYRNSATNSLSAHS